MVGWNAYCPSFDIDHVAQSPEESWKGLVDVSQRYLEFCLESGDWEFASKNYMVEEFIRLNGFSVFDERDIGFDFVIRAVIVGE